MMGSAVAKRYGKALFEVALQKKQIEQVEEDLKQVVETVRGSKELKEWLNHPQTQKDKKKELLTQIFPKIQRITRNLLFLLIDRHRENEIEAIYEAYRQLVFDHKGLAEAIVTTAFPLSPTDRETLINTFQPITGKKLIIKEIVDSDLLGGVIVQVGDRLYDGSLRTKLKRFQDRLKNTRVG